MKKETKKKENVIEAKNGFTGNIAMAKFEFSDNPRVNGLAMEGLLEEMGWKLGCKKEDLEIKILNKESGVIK